MDGTTLSVTMKGRTLIRAHRTLSEDGKTLNGAFTQYLPDASDRSRPEKIPAP